MSATVGSAQRGQSEVIGIVLLFALVIGVSVAVVVVGSSTLSEAQSDTVTEGAELTMLEFQSKLANIDSNDKSINQISFKQSQGGQQGVDQPSGAGSFAGNSGSVTVDESAGKITVEYNPANGSSTDLIDDTMGMVVYQRDGQKLAYQGGGIFRKHLGSDSSVMVSTPNFQYQYRNQDPTLRLGITKVTGSASGDTFSVQKANASPVPSIDNPLGSGDFVNITVESEFTQAWAGLFRERTDGTVTPLDLYGDGSPDAVKLVLTGPESTNSIVNAALSDSSDNGFKPSNNVEIDSYDSSTGEHGRSNAPVYVQGEFFPSNKFYVDGNVYIDGHADINLRYDSTVPRERIAGDLIAINSSSLTSVRGNLEIGGDLSTTHDLRLNGENGRPGVEVSGNVYVGGDVTHMEDVDVNGNVYVQGDMPAPPSTHDNLEIDGDLYVGGSIDGTWEDIADDVYSGASVNPPSPLTFSFPSQDVMDDEIDDYRDKHDDSGENDNNKESGDIDDIEDWDDNHCNPCTLNGSSDGRDYYLDGMHLENGEKLVFDTSDGPISLYSEPDAENNRGLHLSDAQIEVQGNNSVKLYTKKMYVANGGSITTSPTPHQAGNFRVFLPSDGRIDLGSGGIAKVTGALIGPGADIQLDGKAEVYGGIVGDVSQLSEAATIHFDEDLLSPESSGTAPAGSDSVSFLKVTRKTVKVTD